METDYKAQVITEGNVVEIAEHIAYYALNSSLVMNCNNKLRWNLIHGLQNDWQNKDNPQYIMSDAYDLVQTAVVVLCEYVGRKLNEIITYNKKPLSVIDVCYKTLNAQIYNLTKEIKTHEFNDNIVEGTLQISCNTDKEERLQEIVIQLGLSPKQNEILQARLNGQGYTIIGKSLNKTVSTIVSSCVIMQRKVREYYALNNLRLIQCSNCKRIIGVFYYKQNEMNEKCYCDKCAGEIAQSRIL